MMRALLIRMMANVRNLSRGRRADEEVEREIALHVALLEEKYQRQGMPPEEAHAAARRKLGGVEQAKQAHRDQRSWLWLEQTRQPLKKWHARPCE